MPESTLLFELLAHAAGRTPSATALTYGAASLSYEALQADVERFARGVLALGLQRGERVGIYLEKRFETVVASFGAPAAGGVFVPLNPLLKAEQVGHVLRDCNVRVLVTSAQRLVLVEEELQQCPDLRHVVLTDTPDDLAFKRESASFHLTGAESALSPLPSGECALSPLPPGERARVRGHAGHGDASRALTPALSQREREEALTPALSQREREEALTPALSQRERGSTQLAITPWPALLDAPHHAGHRVIDIDIAAILYTSGSTGKPKGVVLSHRNMVAGAKSVASYLGNVPGDTLLAALPLSFDAGFSQLTTAFHAGARVVLLNYLLPRDVMKALEREHVTGLTAVPPLYIQLAQLEWPPAVQDSLRYFANTGGRMPLETLTLLRRHLPKSRPFLMYGLTEAFRSTYLPPEEVDRRPDSIGKAIPNAEILVLRDDGTPCGPDEPGELVHRGALVGMGYWNDAAKTAERYKLLPHDAAGHAGGLQLPEFAVYSGDTVRRDTEGFLYFVGRRDEMIKTSGYRVSPAEVEEVLYATKRVGECVAFGVEHASLGQVIQVIATAPAAALLPVGPGAETGFDAAALAGDSDADAPCGTTVLPGGSDAGKRLDTADDAVETRFDIAALLAECRARMPAYMVPAGVEVVPGPLPRNPNGKIDRKRLAAEWAERQGVNS